MDPRRSGREKEYLSDPVATRVLARASELEALRRAGASVAELRAAAVEAGISEDAFEEALAEIRRAESAGVPDAQRSRRFRIRITATVAIVVLLVAGLLVGRTKVPARAPASVAQTFHLRCIPAHEAASMLRPALVQSGSISFSMRVPTALTITGTPDQLRLAREILAKEDVRGSPSCPVR